MLLMVVVETACVVVGPLPGSDSVVGAVVAAVVGVVVVESSGWSEPLPTPPGSGPASGG